MPTLGFGTYTTKTFDDTTDVYFNTINARVNLNTDVLKFKSLSLLSGIGLGVLHASGLSKRSGYFNAFGGTANGVLGLRVKPATEKLAYELLFAGSISGGEFYEAGVKIRVIFLSNCKKE